MGAMSGDAHGCHESRGMWNLLTTPMGPVQPHDHERPCTSPNPNLVHFIAVCATGGYGEVQTNDNKAPFT